MNNEIELISRDTIADEILAVIAMLNHLPEADAAAWRLVALHRELIVDFCIEERQELKSEIGGCYRANQ